MNELNWFQKMFQKVLGVILRSPTPTTMTVCVNGELRHVKNGITFSELDDRFGKGNWSL